jgi:hypothetical protein
MQRRPPTLGCGMSGGIWLVIFAFMYGWLGRIVAVTSHEDFGSSDSKIRASAAPARAPQHALHPDPFAVTKGLIKQQDHGRGLPAPGPPITASRP